MAHTTTSISVVVDTTVYLAVVAVATTSTAATATFSTATASSPVALSLGASFASFAPFRPVLEPFEMAGLGPSLHRVMVSFAVLAYWTALRYESTSVDIITSWFGVGGALGTLATTLPLP